MALRKLKPGRTGELLLERQTALRGPYSEVREAVEIVKPEEQKDFQLDWQYNISNSLIPGDLLTLKVKREFTNRLIFRYVSIDGGALADWRVEALIQFFLAGVKVAELDASRGLATNANLYPQKPRVDFFHNDDQEAYGPQLWMLRQNGFNVSANGVFIPGIRIPPIVCDEIRYNIGEVTVGVVGQDLFLGVLSTPL